MPREKTTPKLTEHQRYVLGQAVEHAYINREWDGKEKSTAPTVSDIGYRGVRAPVPTIKVLLRTKMISTAKDGRYPLTKTGLEVGIAECIERRGSSPAVEAEQKRKQKEKEINALNRQIADACAPLRGIRVTGDGTGKVDLAAYAERKLKTRGELKLERKQIEQLGAAIQKLR